MPQVPGIVIFKANAMGICKLPQANKKYTPFFLVPFYCFWGARSRCYQRLQLCALRLTGRLRCAAREWLLTAEFAIAFARFVLYTEKCHKYTHTHKEQVCTYTHKCLLIHLPLCAHIYYIFRIFFFLNYQNSFAQLHQLSHLIHGRFWQIQAHGTAKRSRDAIGKLLVRSGSSSSWTTAPAAGHSRRGGSCTRIKHLLLSWRLTATLRI